MLKRFHIERTEIYLSLARYLHYGLNLGIPLALVAIIADYSSSVEPRLTEVAKSEILLRRAEETLEDEEKPVSASHQVEQKKAPCSFSYSSSLNVLHPSVNVYQYQADALAPCVSIAAPSQQAM